MDSEKYCWLFLGGASPCVQYQDGSKTGGDRVAYTPQPSGPIASYEIDDRPDEIKNAVLAISTPHHDCRPMSRLLHTRLLVPSRSLRATFAFAVAVAEARADTGQSCSKSYAANLIAIAQKYGATKPQARLEDVGRSNAAFVECVFAERQPEIEGDLIGTGKMLTNDGQFVQVNPDGDWVLYVPAAPDTAHQRATQIDANLRSALGDGASVLPLRWDGLAIAEQRRRGARLKAAGWLLPRHQQRRLQPFR